MTRIIILLLLTCQMLCCTQPKNELTESDKEIILNEIRPILKDFVDACEAADFNKAFKIFKDTLDFTAIGNGKASPDYQSFKAGVRVQFEALVSQHYTFAKEKFNFISSTSVLYTALGSNIDQLKNGSRILVDPLAVSFLFQKSNKEWKIVYMHESATIKMDSSRTK